MDWCLDKGTERRPRQSSDEMDQVSKRKTWTLWLALRQVQGPNALLRPSRPCTPCPVRSPPSTCLQKLFVMLPSATLKSTFSFSDYNTQTTQIWPKQQKQRLVVSKHRRTHVRLILIQEQPFLLALALRAVKHLRESTSTNPLPAKRPPRNLQTTSPEHTMLASRKRRSRSP